MADTGLTYSYKRPGDGHFFCLPRELRDEVYSLAYGTDKPVKVVPCDKLGLKVKTLSGETVRKPQLNFRKLD